MEFARPIGGTSTESPSIFDVLAHEGTAALLPRFALPTHSRKIKLTLLLADLMSVWLAKGRLTELLFGIERGGGKWRILQFMAEVLIEERAHFFGNFSSRIPARLFTVLDVLSKLLFITGDSQYYGVVKTLLRIPYHQSHPRESLRWALFWGQAVLNIMESLKASKKPVNKSTSTIHFPRSSIHPRGKCPGCLRVFQGMDRLFMLPNRGIVHCSPSCLGVEDASKYMTIFV